jgi:hypothetical protein
MLNIVTIIIMSSDWILISSVIQKLQDDVMLGKSY